jgi:hypothetical protein
MSDLTYRLIALCARIECGPTHYDRLAQEAARLTEREWDGLPAHAEAHGMAPLLYTHLKAAQVPIPFEVQRKLQGCYARHRHASRVYTRILRDVLTTYNVAGIQALVLKGAALTHLIYPEPGLRPMSDLDILVSRSDLWQAQSLLAELGFNAPLPSGPNPSHRHLPTATLQTEGLSVQVEIHHQLLSDYFDSAFSYLRSMIRPTFESALARPLSENGRIRSAPASTRLNGPTLTPLPFTLGDLTAYTLGPDDMLRHLCRHLTSHVNVWDYGRLIWVADIVSWAERFVSQIDWQHIRSRQRDIIDTLSLLHFMTPLSEELLDRAGIEIGQAPEQIGEEYQGWPRVDRSIWRAKGSWRVLHDTLLPSEWWLRLRYRLGSSRPLFWYRWIRHPLYILGHVVRVAAEWIGWPTPLTLAGTQVPEQSHQT